MLAALATDAATGALAGGTALGLYLAAEAISGREGWGFILSAPSSIRLVAYVAAGVAAGWFATRARTIVADSLRVLDDLLAFARRDPETGLHTRDAFEDALEARVAEARPFALLVVETTSAGPVAAALPGAELARLGRGRFAALVEAAAPEGASAAADAVPDGAAGWAFHPDDGDGALALFAAAGERLQARRVAPSAAV